MKAKSFATMRCSIARALDEVGHWWSLLIIRDALMGARRFGEFERSLGIAKHTLSQRLAALVEAGILRKISGQTPARGEYVLTEKGRDLAPVLMALAQWGDRWTQSPQGRSFAFVDKLSGKEIAPILPRRADGGAIGFDDIRLVAQPARTDSATTDLARSAA